MRWMMFTKHLQPLPLSRAGEAITDLGFTGADLTVRPGGYVEPNRVRQDLPAAVAVLQQHGLAVPLLTTAITSAADAFARDTFAAAANVGTKEIKLGYWRYGAFGSLRSALDKAALDLDGIEALARSTGVRANLHTHSEDFLTAQAPFVWQLLKDRDPALLGAYIDPGHLCVEGGGDGWRMGLDLLRTHTSLVAVKDLDWQRTDDPDLGKARWYTRMVPLREGIVPWPNVFACLREIGFDGWLSVHSEYQGPHSWQDLSTAEVIEQTRRDLVYLKTVSKANPAGSSQAVNRRGSPR